MIAKNIKEDKLFGLLIFIGVLMSLYSLYVSYTIKPYDYKKWQSEKMETISQRAYMNETVEIDGKIFDHCKFNNVTFMYHGTAPTMFLHTEQTGNIVLKTDNQAISGFIKLDSAFSKLDVYEISHFEQLPNGTMVEINQKKLMPTTK